MRGVPAPDSAGVPAPDGAGAPLPPIPEAGRADSEAGQTQAQEARQEGGAQESHARESGVRLTPMLAQYFEIKEQYRDCLLFFRMGDFFELFFDDAEVAAPILQVQLTKRGLHEGKEVAMCGVPVRAVESYLARLIREGYRVALCDQVETAERARQRGGKQIVKREVVRLVTPGTLSEDALLEARTHNYLLSVARVRGVWGGGVGGHIHRRIFHPRPCSRTGGDDRAIGIVGAFGTERDLACPHAFA